MNCQAQTVIRGVFVHFAKLFWSGVAFVPANADPDYVAVFEPDGLIDYPAGLVYPKWRTASKIQYSDIPKSRSARWRPRSAPSKRGANSCPRHCTTPAEM